ncbi:MAG: 5-oxoprolinase subunit PxpB [Bacteroidetes bacterium]|nr:5-oxoprolinase subunit PxpB [Bacteroidota bacterium]
MRDFQLTYKQYGERSILIEWPSRIDKNILVDIIFFKEKLESLLFKETIEVKSAYSSILISYNSTIENIYDKISTLKSLYSSKINLLLKPTVLWRIPVCYDEEFGIDLVDISNQKRISKQDIINMHSEAIYTVFFIGFLPGFLYLGGLNNAISFPRKSTPRLKISKGAVAIGENQTGIYPSQSPGGWNVIGNTPIKFFDINKKVPCFASPGDKIQFYPITLKKHRDIATLVNAGVYQMESEVVRG